MRVSSVNMNGNVGNTRNARITHLKTNFYKTSFNAISNGFGLKIIPKISNGFGLKIIPNNWQGIE